MAQPDPISSYLSSSAGQLQIDTDVLVIGGGPAGAWAAVAAAAHGANVTLVDKGFCGTSGATAPSGTGLWHVPRDKEAREHAKASRYAMGGELAEHAWMDRVLEQTWINTERLTEWGYLFPIDDQGQLQRTSLQGPEYMRLMRKKVKEAGARILDHSPALELLTDESGRVAGATGITRTTGETWVVRAGAVVIATGGCAFLSRALGCNVLTGDGYLLGAEVGAELSGMEFSNAYGLGPSFSSVTKSLFYNWATFYDREGVPIEGAGSSRGRSVIAKTLQTQPVYACLDKADAAIRGWMRHAQPNFFVSFDRQGIDPFTQHFPVALRLEGTVRGTRVEHLHAFVQWRERLRAACAAGDEAPAFAVGAHAPRERGQRLGPVGQRVDTHREELQPLPHACGQGRVHCGELRDLRRAGAAAARVDEVHQHRPAGELPRLERAAAVVGAGHALQHGRLREHRHGRGRRGRCEGTGRDDAQRVANPADKAVWRHRREGARGPLGGNRGAGLGGGGVVTTGIRSV